MATWSFFAADNGGKHQYLKIRASSKPEAINKGFENAKKKAAGDIIGWDCRLIMA